MPVQRNGIADIDGYSLFGLSIRGDCMPDTVCQSLVGFLGRTIDQSVICRHNSGTNSCVGDRRQPMKSGLFAFLTVFLRHRSSISVCQWHSEIWTGECGVEGCDEKGGVSRWNHQYLYMGNTRSLRRQMI